MCAVVNQVCEVILSSDSSERWGQGSPYEGQLHRTSVGGHRSRTSTFLESFWTCECPLEASDHQYKRTSLVFDFSTHRCIWHTVQHCWPLFLYRFLPVSPTQPMYQNPPQQLPLQQELKMIPPLIRTQCHHTLEGQTCHLRMQVSLCAIVPMLNSFWFLGFVPSGLIILALSSLLMIM